MRPHVLNFQLQLCLCTFGRALRNKEIIVEILYTLLAKLGLNVVFLQLMVFW